MKGSSGVTCFLAASLMVFCHATIAAKAAPPVMLSLNKGVTENFPKAQQAVQLVLDGDFAKARDILLSLTQKDFACYPRREMMDEDRMEIVQVPPIGNRDLLLARCHLELEEHDPARTLMWGLIENEWKTQEFFTLFVTEFRGDNFEAAMRKLDDIQKANPDNDTALLARQYLAVSHALPNGDIAAAVNLIRSGSWDRHSESGPLAEFKNWACEQLVKYPETTIPVLIKALEVNEQPTWIIYCLGLTDSRTALVPLGKTRERISNSYARLEIDAAIARIKTAVEKPVKLPAGSDGKPAPSDADNP